ncbi:RNA polymerase sigma-H factor [Dictyobacter alpinus]|uniref:RNA polymerase sigma-H factor n=2 Tax=Dictyobacter alpinus TaxID=2014873 RepID=A0A402B042_9CHLR|nr:RNA polymerase sigma-H factor [Dictyobacter alpinus]
MNVVENETQLVDDACHGSLDAFESLVKLYEPRIRRMLYGMTQDVQLTQDLCQDTFLAAYRALPRMEGKNLRFAPWLYRIALNLVRSEWRHHKHIKMVPFATPSGNDEHYFEEQQGEDYLVSDEHFEEQVMQRELVRRALAQLPESSAMCLLLDAEGYSYNEIAETLQDSLSAVRSRLARARQAFQRIYNRLDQEGR